ncbi:MAG: RNA 2',3'-cyclic phosphodiesterase [Candidatus Promineifilaceae bacterium]
MSKIRAFIAIDVPDEVRKSLDDAIRILGRELTHGGVRWVKSSNIHLTLRFLGNVSQEKLPALYDGLDDVAAGSAPFSLDLDVLGCFPNPRRPRIVWVGLVGNNHRLSSLHRAIERMLVPSGWEEEGRKYHPHLTLGRVKDSNKVVEARLPWGDLLVKGRIEAKAIHLIESQLLSTGAVYSIRHSGYLTG